MAKSLILRSLQSVLFTTAYQIENKLGFSSEFLKHTQKIFTNDPNIITAPKNAPPQVPMIEIKSPNQAYIAQFSNNRIAFHFQDTQNMNASLENIFPHFLDALQQETQCTMEFLNPRVVRLGFIVARIADIGYSTNRFLSEEFMKNNPFPDAHEMNLGILYKVRIGENNVNRWVRYRTLRAQNDPNIDYAMAIEIDINTLAEEMNDFSASHIMAFYKSAYENITTDLDNYPLLNNRFDSEQ
ncbi:hypothetical protein JW926_18920 [Candidatus Sumerlaeota bacterium]|nr:hypothetical protein [Candidatus Sumerlaeota bacterium]